MLRSRYRRITFFFARVFIGLIFWELVLPFLRFRNLTTRTRKDRLRKIAVQFRSLATDMGGVGSHHKSVSEKYLGNGTVPLGICNRLY